MDKKYSAGADSEMRDITACFTGNRAIAENIRPELEERTAEIISRLYSAGYRRFFCGGAIGFDTVAALNVISFQKDHTDVQLILAVPCDNQAQKWGKEDADTYERIKSAADEVRILSPHYYTGCMDVRNRYMVDRSSFCVSYMTSSYLHSGTWSTVAYAISCGITVQNLAMRKDMQILPNDTMQFRRFVAEKKE